MKTKPKDWRKYERHPLSARYADITGTAWVRFLANLQEQGLGDRTIFLHEGKIIEGWQLYRGCLELGIKPKFAPLPKGTDPEKFVETANDFRRHETPEEVERRAAERRERVAAGRQEGKSTRTIATEEGVSHTQVLRDLEAAGEPPGSPESSEGGTDVPPAPAPAKVTGADGKQYPAAKPPVRCSKCARLNLNLPDCLNCKAAREEAKPPPRQTAPAPRTRATVSEVQRFGTWLDDGDTKLEEVAALHGKSGRYSGVSAALEKLVSEWKLWARDIGQNPEPRETLPAPLDNQAFRTAWAEWHQYLKEKKKKATPSTRKAQIKQLVKMGEEGAIASINQSIEKGWTGLFPVSSNGKAGKKTLDEEIRDSGNEFLNRAKARAKK